MLRFTRTLSLLLGLCCPAACAEDPAKVAALRDSAGSVWVVESPTTRVYLCGTIHLLRSGDYPLPSAYDVAYQDSQHLIFELPPGAASDPALAQKMASAGTYPDGEKLSSKIKPESWQALTEWCAKRRFPASTFEAYRPWYAALLITTTEYQAVGAEADRGVDSFFEAKAKQESKPGSGLETLDFQIGLFANLTAQQQAELLEQTLDEVKRVPQEYEKMIAAWRAGDAETLHNMLFEEAREHPELLDLFLVKRNQAWIAPLEERLRGSTPTMVLVGTGHLGGESGVMALLKAKGYSVKKVAPMPH